MQQWIKDTAGLGTVLWLIGYLASLLLFFSPFAAIMGWILLVVCTPVTIAVAWWWFKARDLENEKFVANLKCHDANGEIYYVDFSRSRVRLSSYTDDAIQSRVETWADTVPELN